MLQLRLDDQTLLDQLAESTLLDKIIDNMEYNLLKDISRTESHEKNRREELYNQIRTLPLFKASFREHVNNLELTNEDD